jgi:hypothetical protein
MTWEGLAEALEGAGWLGTSVGAVAVAVVLVPSLSKGMRPAVKSAVKAYLLARDRAQQFLEEGSERWQDLLAEAKAECQLRSHDTELMTLELRPE